MSVALLLYDVAGNPAPLVGLTHFTKNYSCPIPPPDCIPGLEQVTLFEDQNFQGGCAKFDKGNYPTANSLNPLGNDDAESILTGASVIATLFSEENFSGHSQSFITNTSTLRYQWVPENTLSSLMVLSRTTSPLVPVVISPMEAMTFRKGDIVPLSWQNGGGAVEYQVEIYLESVLFMTLPWQSDPVRYVDSLRQGNYTWRVQGRNEGGVSSWTEMELFSIESPIVIPQEFQVPYFDTMEIFSGLLGTHRVMAIYGFSIHGV